MATYDAQDSQCFVFTFKEGLLSPMAHDLRIAIGTFSIDVDEASGSIVASFDTSSLRVDTPMKDGAENPSALSASDKEKIAGQIREDVLHSSKFPAATFRSTSVSKRADGGFDITGDLTLHGTTKPIQARSELSGGRQQVELTVHQPDFGITPYKAMLGTLKIQPDVKIRIVA
jgi:polyisoprenoid-binding protein YceI